MMCVCLFLCLYTTYLVEIMLQFQTLMVVFDSNVNILGALWRSKVKFSNIFQKNREKQKKSDGKREFLCKTSFGSNCFIW
ncbi:hypothetical protein FWK35_00020353 [Aphis craccivora]|uniref:Secreted protein n=1 Tax=Aphis craccivora TaxID=307492 RepID=A0A6G0YR00_APHCR|nr:hypothetical protein FWK35_00020353 [Aphis craccivora]